MDKICGPRGDERCCGSLVVPGGTFDRGSAEPRLATVSDFRLDRFEVTVGRFRAFLSEYPASWPAVGAGAHPKIPDSGWRAAWDANLPVDRAALSESLHCEKPYFSWTDEVADLQPGGSRSPRGDGRWGDTRIWGETCGSGCWIRSRRTTRSRVMTAPSSPPTRTT
ncbi:hypothetical protein [Sorangium sp. So ce426]|uniref:hypothetical protein n=1 Tax=Sorangium sp. So ce426 TaxID=3133312 RepID=UPI003F5B2C09